MSYDPSDASFNLVFPKSAPLLRGWTFQVFIDGDEDEQTGYGSGYDLVLRGGLESSEEAEIVIRRTEGGGGPGGWGEIVGEIALRRGNDRELSFTLPLETMGLPDGHFRYTVESYLDERLCLSTAFSGNLQESRLSSGTIGVWSMGRGLKYWDDLTVSTLRCDRDSDADGLPDCEDGCPFDPRRTAPDLCGCVANDGFYAGDYQTFLECLGGPTGSPDRGADGASDYCIATSDADGDGDVDLADLAAWLPRFEQLTAATLPSCAEFPADDSGQRREDFERYWCTEDPLGWTDTGAGNAMAESDALFGVFCLEGEQVLATYSEETNIHSHVVGSGSALWSAYAYTGRMMRDDPGGRLGITFFSEYPNRDAYYRLRYLGDERGFYIAPHNSLINGGATETGVEPSPGVWYLFRIEVQDKGTHTDIRARVWPEGTLEPDDWPVDCYSGTMDGDSFAEFGNCFAGPLGATAQGADLASPICRDTFDMDDDGDVDLWDFSAWSRFALDK